MQSRNRFALLSTYVGQPQRIGSYNGRDIYSSFRKTPVSQPTIHLGYGGLAGDQPTDQRPVGNGRQVHGGRERTLLVFPTQHYAGWAADSGENLLDETYWGDQAFFGENMRIGGDNAPDEHTTRTGDEWLWGETLLRVTGHRRPCFKLRMVRGDGAPEWMKSTGRCGWYLQVVRNPGMVPTYDAPLEIVKRGDGPTIAQSFADKIRREPAIPGPHEEP